MKNRTPFWLALGIAGVAMTPWATSALRAQAPATPSQALPSPSPLTANQTPIPSQPPAGVKGGAVVNGFQITAWTDSRNYNKSGYPLLLHLKIKNYGGAKVVISGPLSEVNFVFKVTDGRGKPVALTNFGRRNRFIVYYPDMIKIDAGKEYLLTIALNRLVDLTEEDNYSVIAERHLMVNEKGIIVRSNAVKFSINNSPDDYRSPLRAPSTPITPTAPPAPVEPVVAH